MQDSAGDEHEVAGIGVESFAMGCEQIFAFEDVAAFVFAMMDVQRCGASGRRDILHQRIRAPVSWPPSFREIVS